MMRTMRENTKWIMLLTALAFIALMVFEWGMDLSGRSSAQASGGEIGRVNGDPVNYTQFRAVYEGLYRQQQQLQDGPITAAQNREIEEAAWNQLVMEMLVQQELRKRGITASDAEVRQAARIAPPPEFYANELFQTNGQFDLAKYQQFLASPAVDDQLLLQLEAYYRDLIARNKLYRQVTAGSYMTERELWRLWQDQNEKVRARFIALDPEAMIGDEAVTVTDAEVEAFYRSHRNDFQRPARASLRLVALDKAPTAADTAAARERALAVRKEIVDGADFAEVARRESADPGSAALGGDLGTFGKGQMVPAFEQAVWSLRINQVSEPVETPYGFHIIQVQKRTADEATARHILIPIQRTAESEDALLERADSLERLGESMSLADAAERLGLSVRTAEITEGLPFVAGLGRLDDAADWAFNEAKKGDVSPVFETPTAYYMVELVEAVPAGTLTLEEAAPGIRARLLANKKIDEARKIARDLVDKVRQASLDEAAKANGIVVRETEPFSRTDYVPGLGQANAAIGTAFGLEAGQTSGLVEAQGAFFIIQTVERFPADRAEFEARKDQLREQLALGLEQERWNRFLASLRENAKVVDNRAKVLSASAR
jgi:peptidyl-prolyl cis-trans isomerase D